MLGRSGRRLLRVCLALSCAGLVAAPALPASAASAASIVDCPGQPGCFTPNPLTIPAGTSVTWSNGSSAAHTATSDTNAWTTPVLAPGQTSAAITFATPGTFTYHCAIHRSMRATIVVTAAAIAPPAPTPRGTARALAAGGAGPLPPFTLVLGLLAVISGLALLVSRRRPA